MYPPEIGLRAEDSILEQLVSQARETLTQLKTDGVVGDDMVLRGSKILRHSSVPLRALPG
jgi:hypothetical protein